MTLMIEEYQKKLESKNNATISNLENINFQEYNHVGKQAADLSSDCRKKKQRLSKSKGPVWPAKWASTKDKDDQTKDLSLHGAAGSH